MPLVPAHSERIHRNLLGMFAKPEVLASKTLHALMQSEYGEKLVAVRRINIGMAANRALSKADVSESEKLHLLKGCQAVSLFSDPQFHGAGKS